MESLLSIHESPITDHRSLITDVIVIGSGPAGCAAASTCTKAGLNVLIVTDESEHSKPDVSIPVPLESIHPGLSSLLEKIGAEGVEQTASQASYSGIYAGNTYTPLGEDQNGIWKGMHINREIFNAQLLHRIQNSGVQVKFNEKVEDFIFEKAGSRSSAAKIPPIYAGGQGAEYTEKVIGIKSRSGDLHAKYIIDASGKQSIAGKKLKFKRKFFSPPLVCWTGVSVIDATFHYDPYASYFIPGKDGWTWLASQPPNYCTWTLLKVKSEKSLMPPDELKEYPTVGKIQFANMRWRLFRPVCSEGVILCGDAAGILDPAAGQGIFNALLSGITAANTIVKCIHEPDLASFHLAYYDDWFVQQFEAKVKQLRLYYAEHGINILNQ